MKKYALDLVVVEQVMLTPKTSLLKLSCDSPLPPCLPGQFVEMLVEHTPSVLLRRPISINLIEKEMNRMWLLIQVVGDGSDYLAHLQPGDKVNVLMPLGNGFTMPDKMGEKVLLVGGGVGCAPMACLGLELEKRGTHVTSLIGARSAADLVERDLFERAGRLCITTEDGSQGEKGFVTNHTVLMERFDRIYSCGPKPMMVAVARYAQQHDIWCELSLENHMACGVGACLCCVENTREGNRCVCTDGPVFNREDLLWLN